MPIRTNARRRARFSTRIRQVGVDVTGARLGESDGSSSIAGSLWYYCALRLLATTHEHVPYVYLVLSDIRSLRFFDLEVDHADDAWNISARFVWYPSSTSSDRLARARAQRRICNGGLSCFPSVPAQVGRARSPATRPLQSDLSRTRDSTSTTRGRVCPVRHLNRDSNRGHIKPTFQ